MAWWVLLGVANLAFFLVVGNWGRSWPGTGEYFLTGALEDLWWSPRGLWMAPVQFVLGYVAGRAGGLRWWTALLGCVAVYFALVMMEFAYDETSHNLLPFELVFWAASCSPVALGALLAQLQARRAGRVPSP